jgi:cyanate permease
MTLSGSRVKQVRLDPTFWKAAALAVLITACCSLPVFLVGGLAVQIRGELDLPISSIGFLTAIFFVSSAGSSAYAGRIAEGIGAERSMRTSALLGIVALTGLSLAPSYLVLAGFLALGGVASALGQVGANLHLATRVDRSRQAFAFGIKQSAIPAATLVGGLSVPLIALTVGWRWAFVLGAAITVVVLLVVPRREGGARTSVENRVRPHKVKALVVLSVAGAFGSGAANAMGSYLVDSSVSAGLGEATAGLLFASGSVVGLSIRMGTGWLADRRTGGRLLWVAGLYLVGSIGFLLQATRSLDLLWLATGLCFGGGWGWPGLFNFAVVTRNPEAPAAATGLTQTGVYLGGTAGPLLFGVVAERMSYQAAWLGASVFGLIACGAVLLGRAMLLKAGEPEAEY